MNNTLAGFPVCWRGDENSFKMPCSKWAGMVMAWLALIATTAPAPAAQTISIGSSAGGVAPADIYSGVNYSGIHSNGCTIKVDGGTDKVDLQVTNLPAGVTVYLQQSAIIPVTPPVTLNLWMGIAVTNVAAGDYTLYLVASSTNTSITPAIRTFGLHVGNRTFWVANNAANNAWSVNTNWSPYPPDGKDVVFENQPVDVGTNNVTVNTTIGRLSYLRSVNNTYWRTVLSSGVILTVTNGFSANSISADNSGGNSHSWGLTLTGSGGASLIVTNRNKDFSLSCVDNGSASPTYTFNLGGLPCLKAYVNRFGFNDLSLITEGTVGSMNVNCTLPLTNIIVACYTNPGSYSDPHFTNSIQFGNYDDQTAYAQNGAFTVGLGRSNIFCADSFSFGRCRLAASATKQMNFTASSSAARFRNVDNVSRMSFFGVGVDSGSTVDKSGSQALVDFTGSGNTVDLLADTMWLGRCRLLNTPGGGTHLRGRLYFGSGTVDVNTVYLGYQQYTNDNDCQGTIGFTNGTLVVNNLMVLGYTSGDWVTNRTSGPFPADGFGKLDISGASGVARLNTVTVGGPAQMSVNNNISVSANASLILTNTIGAADAKLNLLAMNAASLTLHLNGIGTRIFTKSVTTVGTCTINIAAITNTGAFPAEIPLISYETQSATFSLGALPSASPVYGGYLTNDASINAICLVLTNGPWQPGPVSWVGNISGGWDLTTTNWLNGSTPYKYADGITARFDDSGQTNNINLTTTLSPAGTTVSNNAVAYTFGGAGKLSGNGGLTKQGPGTLILANSGANDFSGGITISGGTLQIGNADATGSLGSGNLTDNAALVFNRTGSLVVANAISGSGTLTQNGAGTIILGGTNTYTGDTTINAGTLALTGSSAISGSANILVAAGAALDASSRTDGTLTLASGQTLRGNGTIQGSLTASAGSTVSPGLSVGRLTVTNAVVLQGTTVVEINKTTGTNDLLTGAAGIGYGGTLVVSNLGATFANNDSFKIFDASAYSGAFSSIVPAIPGSGLEWDTSDLTNSGTLKVALGPLTWTGATNGNWDTITTNWLSFVTPTTYTDGSRVQFDDTALTGSVNLTATLAPASIMVNNSSLAYSFAGSGQLTGTNGLTKLGSGTLTIANTGVNDFSGGMLVNGGTLQIGNGGTGGNPGGGNLTNNAALVFNRAGSLTVTNTISGTGTLAKTGTGAVTLTGANTYSGVTAVNAGVLALAGSGAISGSASITIAAGAVLDASGRTDGTLTLAGGQTLQGKGTVSGSLTAGPGSTVSPGQSLGELTVTNAVVLQGTTVMEIDKTAGTNDLLGGAASITYGGTLVVSNLTDGLTNGDSFKLFDADAYAGAFINIVPKRPGPGLAWDTFALTDSGALGVIEAAPIPPSASLKIDFSVAGRAEAIDPNFTSWVINDASTIISNFNGITITFTKAGPFGTGLTGDWWKSGVDDFGCKMADDGITVDNGNQGGQIELRISGLSPGPHTIATYHNTWADPATHTFSRINISVNGALTVTNLVPSNRVTNNYDATSAYLQVVAVEDQDVVILYQSNTNDAATDKNVWIDGLEIDTVNSTLKAINPTPADGDEHVDVDSGSLTLMWQPAASAVSNDVYFGTVSNDVATATHASPLFKGAQTATNYVVSGLNSLLTYYWRVDEINATNGVAKGDTWYFRKRHLAFPGAEGYGRFARGGRGGVVLEVTNLADSGPGTLRWAVSQTLADNGPRTIVFAVSGLIELQSELNVSKANSKLTIAGQTAPGKGINIKKLPLGCSGGEDLIIRHLRVFPGKYSGQTVNGLGFGGVNNSIMDHCSSGWSMDECIPSRGAQNMTIQYVMISEPLNVAGHKNYPAGTRHGYSSSSSGNIGSWHHDLLANAEGRNWSLAGGLTGDGRYAGRLDIRNNVVYNWNGRTTDGGVAELNFVNNYYKKGPVGGISTYLNPDHGTNADGSYGQRYYSSGNTMPGYPQSNTGGWMTNQPFFPSYVATQSATNAYKIVLSDVGCTQPMVDNHDTRQINEAINGTNTYRGSVSGLAGLPDSETDVGGWENYPEIHRDANWDTDHDGLPDWWERIKGLNTNSPPGDFSDANADLVGDEYTELERYLNWMAAPHYDCPFNGTLDVDLSQYTRGFTLSPIRSVSSPVNGTVVLLGDGKTARFTPAAGFSGLAEFRFSVTDAQGDSMTNKVVGIHVLAANNTAPGFSPPVTDKTINVGVNLSVTNSAADAEVPPQTLTFSLAANPLNATINTNTGVVTWRPQVTQAGTTNLFTVVVADSGSPSLSATQSYHVVVNALVLPMVTSPAWSGGQFSLSVDGQVGPDYAVQLSTNLYDWQTLFITNPPAMPFGWMDTNTSADPMRFYRIKVGPPLP
jgi:autotransporter-associated beta strand protein